jgi:hypothetical protein
VGIAVERGVQAGPFARLRMDNHVEPGAHIGNFVELKKTHWARAPRPTTWRTWAMPTSGRLEHRRRDHHLQLRRRQKAPHQDRRGRVRRQQLDAGGAHRDRRRALRRRRLGNHGAGAPDALAMGRARQVVKEDWARKKRALRKK